MKNLTLNLSHQDASQKLKASLRTISGSALRVLSEVDMYGNVWEAEAETKFTIGQGPVGYTTAMVRITPINENTSLVSYEFKGPLWSFLLRSSIRHHIEKVFSNNIISLDYPSKCQIVERQR